MTLREYRASRGISQEQLGLELGKSKATICDIETSGRCTARLALVIEAHTGGQVNAASLSREIAQARKAA